MLGKSTYITNKYEGNEGIICIHLTIKFTHDAIDDLDQMWCLCSVDHIPIVVKTANPTHLFSSRTVVKEVEDVQPLS